MVKPARSLKIAGLVMGRALEIPIAMALGRSVQASVKHSLSESLK